jgi:hypothetical protein
MMALRETFFLENENQNRKNRLQKFLKRISILCYINIEKDKSAAHYCADFSRYKYGISAFKLRIFTWRVTRKALPIEDYRFYL